jgi:hypothetical protein
MTGLWVCVYRKANTKWSPLLHQCECELAWRFVAQVDVFLELVQRCFRVRFTHWRKKRAKFDRAAATNSSSSTSKRKRAVPLKTSATQGDVGGLDEGRDAVAYLKPHVLHRAGGNNGGYLADAGLHDDLTQHLVRDNLLHGAGYFVANRLFHKVIHLLRRSIAQPGLYLHLLICNMAIGSQIEP